jgi:hypothetical protein
MNEKSIDSASIPSVLAAFDPGSLIVTLLASAARDSSKPGLNNRPHENSNCRISF